MKNEIPFLITRVVFALLVLIGVFCIAVMIVIDAVNGQGLGIMPSPQPPITVEPESQSFAPVIMRDWKYIHHYATATQATPTFAPTTTPPAR